MCEKGIPACTFTDTSFSRFPNFCSLKSFSLKQALSYHDCVLIFSLHRSTLLMVCKTDIINHLIVLYNYVFLETFKNQNNLGQLTSTKFCIFLKSTEDNSAGSPLSSRISFELGIHFFRLGSCTVTCWFTPTFQHLEHKILFRFKTGSIFGHSTLKSWDAQAPTSSAQFLFSGYGFFDDQFNCSQPHSWLFGRVFHHIPS